MAVSLAELANDVRLIGEGDRHVVEKLDESFTGIVLGAHVVIVPDRRSRRGSERQSPPEDGKRPGIAREVVAPDDVGETEAISLASEEAGSLLLIDERKGRRVAVGLGILVAGTLNILEEADRMNLVNFEDALDKLRKTTFRMNEEVVAAVVERVRLRKRVL